MHVVVDVDLDVDFLIAVNPTPAQKCVANAKDVNAKSQVAMVQPLEPRIRKLTSFGRPNNRQPDAAYASSLS